VPGPRRRSAAQLHGYAQCGCPRPRLLLSGESVGEDRILLFHTRELSAPELGTWWELPGGGVDSGETYVDAAVRELREEAGITVMPEQVGVPSWRRIGVFRHRDVRHLQHEVVVHVRLDGAGPGVDATGRLDYEREDYVDYRWWLTRDVIDSGELFYPGSLPRRLARFLAGEQLDEPLELWS
jgi:8-oxo-dGTP pyrophosphatase MutT (NUDIX family)